MTFERHLTASISWAGTTLARALCCTGLASLMLVTPLPAQAGAGEIKIGNTMPYSGPASAYGTIGRMEAAYFKMLNDRAASTPQDQSHLAR
jgi:hypothetical protein